MTNPYITRKNIFYRFQQLVILILHLILLNWMIFALTESGSLSFNQVMLHFLGMSVFGGLLIRVCAYWAKYHHLKTNAQHS